MTTLKDAIIKAKSEPNSVRSQELFQGLKSGALDKIAAQEGIDLSKFKSKYVPESSPPLTNPHNIIDAPDPRKTVGPFAVMPKKEIEPTFFEKQSAQFKKGFGEVAAPTIGAAKRVAEVGLKGSELVQKGLNKVSGLILGEEQQAGKLSESEVLKRNNAGEKLGSFAADVAISGLPLGAAAKATQGAKLATKAISQGVIGTATGAVQSGEVGGEALTQGAIATAMPLGGAALKKAFGSLFGKSKLIQNATGLTRSVATKADDIAQTNIRVGGKVQKAYGGIDDFLVDEGFFKNGIKTTRADMLDHADELLKQAKGSKREVLRGIQAKISSKRIPKFAELTNKLKESYKGILGQEEAFKRINELASKKSLTALDLDDLRKLADDLLPRGAFSGVEPVKVKGLEKTIQPIRKLLAGLDTTGSIQRDNVRIRVLSKLLGVGKQTNPLKSAVDSTPQFGVFTNLAGGAGGAISASFIPGVQAAAPFLAGAGMLRAVSQNPSMASGIVNLMSKEFGKSLPKALQGRIAQEIQKKLPEIIRAATVELSGEVGENLFSGE